MATPHFSARSWEEQLEHIKQTKADSKRLTRAIKRLTPEEIDGLRRIVQALPRAQLPLPLEQEKRSVVPACEETCPERILYGTRFDATGNS